MTYNVECMTGQRMILVTYGPDTDFEVEAPQVHEKVAEALDDLPSGKAVLIADFRQVVMDFGTLVMALNNLTQPVPGSLSDERLHVVFIGSDDLVELGAESLKRTQFGKLDVIVFETLEDATIWGRALLSRRRKDD